MMRACRVCQGQLICYCQNITFTYVVNKIFYLFVFNQQVWNELWLQLSSALNKIKRCQN